MKSVLVLAWTGDHVFNSSPDSMVRPSSPVLCICELVRTYLENFNFQPKRRRLFPDFIDCGGLDSCLRPPVSHHLCAPVRRCAQAVERQSCAGTIQEQVEIFGGLLDDIDRRFSHWGCKFAGK